MERERLIPAQTVIVSNGRIERMGQTTQIRPREGIPMVHCNGKFLLPGLAEMPAHIPPDNAPPEVVERVLALFVLNGVTSVA